MKKTTATILAGITALTTLMTPITSSAEPREGDIIDYTQAFGNTNPIVAYPGAPIYTESALNDSQSTIHACSLGPRMVDDKSPDRVYFAVAAHCVEAVGVDGTVFFDHNDVPGGKVRWIHPEFTRDPLSNDMAVIEITDKDRVGYTSIIPGVNKLPSSAGNSPLGNFNLEQVGDGKGTVCAIGRKSDLRCGVAVTDSGNSSYGFMFKSIKGDSGGVAFVIGQDGNSIYPIGVVSGESETEKGEPYSIVDDLELAKEGGFTSWYSTS